MDYGWTPQQIGEMTLAQIHVYYSGLSDPGQSVNVFGDGAELKDRIGKQRGRFFQRWLNDSLG